MIGKRVLLLLLLVPCVAACAEQKLDGNDSQAESESPSEFDRRIAEGTEAIDRFEESLAAHHQASLNLVTATQKYLVEVRASLQKRPPSDERRILLREVDRYLAVADDCKRLNQEILQTTDPEKKERLSEVYRFNIGQLSDLSDQVAAGTTLWDRF